MSLQNSDTKRHAQTGKLRHNFEHLDVSIPPLDALIIPKAACECKAKRNLLANLSEYFSIYHIVS